MAKLVFYQQDGQITRVESSSLPKSKWDLSRYGLEEDEQMKLFDDSELPADFNQSGYRFDGENFHKIELEPVRDPLAEIDEIKAKIADYDTLKSRVETLGKR